MLFLDVLRQRGNNYYEHNARKAPHVLTFEAELVLAGHALERPVNYGLVRKSFRQKASRPIRRNAPSSFSILVPATAGDRRHEA